MTTRALLNLFIHFHNFNVSQQFFFSVLYTLYTLTLTLLCLVPLPDIPRLQLPHYRHAYSLFIIVMWQKNWLRLVPFWAKHTSTQHSAWGPVSVLFSAECLGQKLPELCALTLAYFLNICCWDILLTHREAVMMPQTRWCATALVNVSVILLLLQGRRWLWRISNGKFSVLRLWWNFLLMFSFHDSLYYAYHKHVQEHY